MAIAKVAVPIKHVLENVTVTVKITGLIKWHLQLWIALRLFRLGALIANIDLNIIRR